MPAAQFEIEEHSKSHANITGNCKPLSSNNIAKNYLMHLGSNAPLDLRAGMKAETHSAGIQVCILK